MDERSQIGFHFPDLPPTSYAREDAKQPPSVRLNTFKEQNPEFPPDIDDDEILKRYIPVRFRSSVHQALLNLAWIPENGELLDRSQHELLERIWDGRQTYIVDETGFADNGLFCEYSYWIDFENKVMEVEGVVEGTLHVPFKEMKIGVLEEMIDSEWRGRMLPGAFQDAINNLYRR
jgi:hypothetical protein